LIASLVGCDRGSPDFENDRGPAPRVVWSSPAQGATGVALRQSVRIQLDRFLRPDSATRQSICIQAGPNEPCLSTSPEYDPVDRVLVARPMAALAANQRYNVRLLTPTAASPEQGLRAFDDVPLAEEASFSFTTGDATAMLTLPEPVRTADFCAAMPAPNTTFKGCAFAPSCHGPGDVPPDPSGARNASGNALILGGPTGGPATDVPEAVRTLLAGARGAGPTVAIETATGPDPTEARRSGNSPFAQNMPYLDPSNPGNSYIVYKLMMVPSAAAACLFDKNEPALVGNNTCEPGMGDIEPWVPQGSGQPPLPGEYDRLKARIRGNGMPGDLPTLRATSAWIAAGATTPMGACQ
jgi:hypothetical protein